MADSVADSIPTAIRLEMSRAGVQVLANRLGVRILHIKGSMVDPGLHNRRRGWGTDVDVIVEPDGLRALHQALLALGWSVYSTFRNGSSFEHAQTYFHPDWGHLDVHRRFPGIRSGDRAAFDELWEKHDDRMVAGIACPVPRTDAQAVLLMLNAARNQRWGHDEAKQVWAELDAARQLRCLELVHRLDAAVAFGAARGELDAYAHRPEYLLWKVTSEGGTRTEEWWGRVLAERTLGRRVRVALRAPQVNLDRLSHRLGREPTAAEVAREFLSRAGRALGELWSLSQRRQP